MSDLPCPYCGASHPCVCGKTDDEIANMTEEEVDSILSGWGYVLELIEIRAMEGKGMNSKMTVFVCPECGSDELEYKSILQRVQTLYQPAEYDNFARCGNCLWDGSCDDLDQKQEYV